MNKISEKTLARVFNTALGISFLLILIFLLLILCADSGLVIWYFYICLYVNLFGFFPLLCLSLIALSIKNYKSYGFQRAAEKSSLRILCVILAGLIIYLGGKEIGRRSNTIAIVLKNSTANTISHIELFGRGAMSELDSLAAYTSQTLIFGGKSILRTSDNDYENEVALVYYFNSRFFRYQILEGPQRWNEFTSPFQLEFYGADSVGFTYLPE